MSKDGIFGALKSALAQVKSRVAELKDERQAVQRKRDAVNKRLHECINRPLSKGAMIELCSRMVDRAAADYRANFSGLAAKDFLRVEAYAKSTKRALVFADVDALLSLPSTLPAPDGGMLAPQFQQAIQQFTNFPPAAVCYFFGDAIKAKMADLWADVSLPHKDDGKSLEEREEEAQKLLQDIASMDAKMAGLDAELGELQDATKIEPPASTSTPEEESTADFIWGGLGVGLQPNPRKTKAAPENMGVQHGEP